MRYLILAAHPDDEVLGCGGSMAKWTRIGHEVHVLIMAEGTTSRDRQRDRDSRKEELSQLAEAAHKAAAILGARSVELLDFPDNRMDSVDLLDVVKVVEERIEKLQPEVVVTHHAGDLNIDHRIVYQAVVTACRPGQTVKRLLSFEVPSSTELQTSGAEPPFMPNWFEDITGTLSLKMKALQAYQSELREWPHARSLQAVEHLAHWRGASVGVEAAEALVLVRNVE
jgi:N-acetylglucosamine malate deacetylase 1